MLRPGQPCGERGQHQSGKANPSASRHHMRAEDLAIAQRVSDVAEAHGLPMAQIALAWLLAKPVVTAPIIGATKPHHLDDAVAAVAVQLSPDEIRQLEEAYQPHPVLGYS